MKIFIDPGHGGDSAGASYKGRLEQDDVLKLSVAIAGFLKEIPGVEVMLSRTGNTNPSITERCAAANVWGADYFLSVHRNAYSPEKACGVEAWVKSGVAVGGNTWNYAKKLVDSLTCLGFADRGVKKGAPAYADYGVNRLTQMHSCLLEVGFIDSTVDNARFDIAFDLMAENIARALCEITGVDISSGTSGDTDLDGEITVEDARKALRAAVGLEKGVKNADMDGDGKITVGDAREILKKAIA